MRLFKNNKRSLKAVIKKTPHRDVFEDMSVCDPSTIPEVIPEIDCVKVIIDGKEIVFTYGQYAYIHISTSMIYGNI